MNQTKRQGSNQAGSILILALIILGSLSFLVYASIARTTQHIHLIANYQHYFNSTKKAELCLVKVLVKLPQLSNARFWSTQEKSMTGLYNRQNITTIEIRKFIWTTNNSGNLSSSCRYIIEYLDTIKGSNISLFNQHILRVTVRYQSQSQTRKTLQVIVTVKSSKKDTPAIQFKNTPKLQQWIQIN